MPMLGNLMEVILYVEDMNRQVAFYRDRLGLAVSYPTDVEDYSEVVWVTLDTGPCTLALHGGGRRRLGDDAPKIVFQVDNIETAHRQLGERGVTLGEIRPAAPGVRVADGLDPEGNKFSIESHD
ncbi:MAG: VOC family protein [Candidatus Promineifilaceae bacterium]|nr:VOC family protein [Candidatus Promineifilaceae bacterium]